MEGIQDILKKYHIVEDKVFALHLHEKTDILNIWSKFLELQVNHSILTAWWIFISSTFGAIYCPSD